MSEFGDTIVALSSGRLPSGIAVIRISGGKTRFALETICGMALQHRMATFRHMRDAAGVVIDSGPVLFFKGPRSFTGEDSGEFHLHGGKAVVSAMLERLTDIDGIRLAEPGEFTRRAFLNGKVDLLQAEGLADLVSAETEAQRRLAVHNAEGAQTELYLGWRRQLIHARAMLEAELDFSDEQDVPGSVSDAIWESIDKLIAEMSGHIAGYKKAEMIRDGFEVVIIGAPNAGKSSLLNALARREVAIVSDEPGTTRDLVEIVLDLGGVKCRITDTAGIRSDPGRVESIGIERALAKAADADLVLHLVDGDISPLATGGHVVVIRSKIDTISAGSAVEGFHFRLSTVTGEGLTELLDCIEKKAVSSTRISGAVLPSRLRHVNLLRKSLVHLKATRDIERRELELVSDELRLAGDYLGRIAGSVDTEDLLDVIFSEFCIGK